MNQNMKPVGLRALPLPEGSQCSAIRDGDAPVGPDFQIA